jgi:hypothetical protein
LRPGSTGEGLEECTKAAAIGEAPASVIDPMAEALQGRIPENE